MRTLLTALAFCFISSIAFAQPRVGDLSPDIALTSLNGNTVKLSSLRGKVVLIDFWASWCIPCRKAIRDIKPVYQKYSSKGFEIYGISVDQNRNEWIEAVEQDKTTWLHVNDNRGAASTLMYTWRVEYIPNTYLLDEQGRVVAVNPRKRQIEDYLKQHLKNEATQ